MQVMVEIDELINNIEHLIYIDVPMFQGLFLNHLFYPFLLIIIYFKATALMDDCRMHITLSCVYE